MDGEQACLAVIEDQTIRHCHFGAHRVTAEDHPWIKNREFADGPVKLSALNGYVLPTLRARHFKSGSNLLPKMIC
jgi:hypothetical protein